MISKYAISIIEEMKDKGYDLTPQEIIRLNALGLKVDRGLDDNPLYLSRRCAFLAGLILREPTIGHSIYAAKCFKLLDVGDLVTRTCLYGWLLALDRVPDADPTVDGLRAVLSSHVAQHYKDIGFPQLKMAVDFCLYGYDSIALEEPVRTDENGKPLEDALEETADDEAIHDAQCFEVGIIHEAMALGLGITLEDALKLSRAQMMAIIDRAMLNQRAAVSGERLAQYRHNLRNKFIIDFQNTVDAIARRHDELKKLKEANAS